MQKSVRRKAVKAQSSGPSSELQNEQPTPDPGAAEKANEGKFKEPRGWAMRWCGFALSSADQSASADTTEEEH
jgi:hypothetical protein